MKWLYGVMHFLLRAGCALFLLSICVSAAPSPDQWVAAVGPANGLSYNQAWVPPGETRTWRMDCSNTARWIYRSATGIELPRTASDQYLYARKNGRVWRISADNQRALAKRLRPGDLLFWEHTYKPTRKPPVTHVMVYVGKDAAGHWLMAGSKSSKGVGVFRFDPRQPSGGYRFFLGIFHRSGRFVGVGRVL